MAATASALRPGVSLGVDLGTSGVRVNVVEATERGVAVLSEASTRWSDADGRRPEVWISALRDTLRNCDAAAVARVSTVAVSGTSASTLLLDGAGRVARPAMMYADPVGGDAGARALEIIKARAPAEHAATKSATSALAKLLTWAQEAPFADGDAAAHQADYVAAALAAGVADERLGDGFVLCSDWHNSLKMGYDIAALEWPAWILEGCLPDVGAPPSALERLRVIRPGAACDRRVTAAAAAAWGLPEGAAVVGGTTDSIAAFVACSTDADAGVVSLAPGNAVTSLGSTTALKLVSETRVDDAITGVYSHRFDDAWLVGGASNAGCRVLRHFDFTEAELADLSPGLDADATNGAGIYPLVNEGERFPVNDAAKQPRLPARNDLYRREILHELLVGISDVEARGYRALADRGATPLVSVATAGGGAKNPDWRAQRSRMLGVPVVEASNGDAAFGAAVLGLRG